MDDVVLIPKDGHLPELQQALEYYPKYDAYQWFEDGIDRRLAQKALYLADIRYAPDYNYDKLRERQFPNEDGESSLVEKSRIQAAISRLQIAGEKNELPQDIVQLYINANIRYLKMQLMVEAADDALRAPGSAEATLAIETYKRLNKEVYGEFDAEAFKQLIGQEKDWVLHFEPKNAEARRLRQNVLLHLGDVEPVPKQELIDQDLIDTYKPFLLDRYGHILDVMPSGDDYLSPEDTNEVFNKAIGASGLADAGWQSVLDKNKTIVATNMREKLIKLPTNIHRTANQLRALMLHELEVHARRGFNGSQLGYPIFETGTANYFDNEEGLGVILEALFLGKAHDNPAVSRAVQRYIHVGLALGQDTSGERPRDARQTHYITWQIAALKLAKNGIVTEKEIQAAKTSTYDHIENIFRSTNFSIPGHIYAKAKIYYEGLIGNIGILRRIAADPKEFDKLFWAKYDHLDPEEAEIIARLHSSKK